MLSEMLIGRIGRQNPVHSVAAVAKLNQLSPKWKWMGTWLVLTGFIVSSYYVVISGWVLSYTWQALAGHLNQLNAKSASMLFYTSIHILERCHYQYYFSINSNCAYTIKTIAPRPRKKRYDCYFHCSFY